MNFYREAAIALRQNVRTVLLFAAVGATLAGADSAFQLFVLKPAAEATDRTLGLGLIGWQIVYVALTSAANAILFARMGREIDKPMWRVTDDRDAMSRFFRLWFLLGLLILVYMHGVGALLPTPINPAGAIVFLVTVFTFATLLNVFGAFVMFYGRPGKQEVREAFATMGQHLGVIVALCLVGIFAGMVLRDLSLAVAAPALAGDASRAVKLLSVLATILAGALDALVGCYIFAYAWLICIFHRDHYEAPGDDFDF